MAGARPGQARLFPTESLRPLFVLSQVGLALYMFCVGLEFHIDSSRSKDGAQSRYPSPGSPCRASLAARWPC